MKPKPDVPFSWSGSFRLELLFLGTGLLLWGISCFKQFLHVRFEERVESSLGKKQERQIRRHLSSATWPSNELHAAVVWWNIIHYSAATAAASQQMKFVPPSPSHSLPSSTERLRCQFLLCSQTLRRGEFCFPPDAQSRTLGKWKPSLTPIQQV